MNLLENWVQTPSAAALGWTLAHSLWEGAIVALALALALCFLRSSRARYTAACLTMLVLVGATGLTFIQLMSQQRLLRAASAREGRIPPAPALDPHAGDANSGAWRVEDVLPWLAPFWIAGVLLFHLRAAASWMAARRLRRTGVCRAPDSWQARLDRLRAQLRLSRPVVLLESCLAEAPVVIGLIRPVILMPVGLLAGLPAGQIEAILLHELAHIRRYDYAVNLLQIFVEGLLFYHPAVWWISGVIRAERENCCDDQVVAATGGAFEYAAALASLEQSRVPREALAATGGSLMKRIRRLLANPEPQAAALAPVFKATILAIVAVATVSAWQTKPPEKETPYEKWLKEDVVYIIEADEKQAFQRLGADEERVKFIEQFWLRRDPTPGTPENEFKQEHYRRIAYANQRFSTATTPGWKTDRGRIYITYGPPDEIEDHPKLQQWLYHHIEGVGANVIIDFVDPTGSGEFHMTMDPDKPQKDQPAPQPAATNATVRVTGRDSALISIPLAAYGNHRLNVYGRTATREGAVADVFDLPIQGPVPVYTKFIPVHEGSYRVKLLIRDLTTGILAAADTLEFEVK